MAALDQLAAFHRHACQAFLAHKRARRDRVPAVRQRHAVVFLRCAVRRQHDLHRFDRQLAVRQGNSILLRHICIGGIHNLHSQISSAVRRAGCILTLRRRVGGHNNLVSILQAGHGYFLVVYIIELVASGNAHTTLSLSVVDLRGILDHHGQRGLFRILRRIGRVIRHLACNGRRPADEVPAFIRGNGGGGRRVVIVMQSGMNHTATGVLTSQAAMIALHIGNGIIVLRPGTDKVHVLARHGKATVRNCRVHGVPAIEGVAGHGGNSFDGHSAAGVMLRGGGQLLIRASGHIAGVSIADVEGLALPHCVEVVRAVVVNAHLTAGGILRRRIGGGSGPAEELVVLAAGQTGGDVVQHGHLRVVLQGIGLRLVRVEVGVIDEGNRRVDAAVDGVQHHILRGNAHLVAGIIAGTGAVGLRIPVEEHAVFRRGHAGGRLNVGKAALGVLLGIRGSGAGAAVQVVGHGKALGAGVVGVQLDVAVDAGIEVEGGVHIVAFGARADAPAAPGITLGNFHVGQRTLVNGLAVCNLNGFGANAFHGQVRHAAYGRREPVRVEHQVAAGHGGAFPVELRAGSAACRGIPPGEFIAVRNAGWPVGGVILAADIRFVVDILNDLLVVAVDEGQVILITGIVEIYIIIIVAALAVILRLRLFGKSSQFLLIPGCLLIIGNNLIQFGAVNVVSLIRASADGLKHVVQMISVPAAGPIERIGCGAAIGRAAQQVLCQVDTL